MLKFFIFLTLLSIISALNGCTEEENQRGLTTCNAAEPEWIQKYSTGAVGPEQRFLNYGNTEDSIVIGWVTANMTADSIVQYGTSPSTLTKTATGSGRNYTYGIYTSGLIHHVKITGLLPKTVYYYRVGDASAWSEVANFTSNIVGEKSYPYTIGTFADVGESAAAQDTINHLLQAKVDAYFHMGDMSYATGA